ncbi:N-acetylmuramic acid 6-phosphate etherase [Pasteurellaceae bacterium HPA106]|uniref:N-acetylmuramic acid 6-phosphate etherase n=1 Tax=Spirabiliibacterium pneumoniae TaxID=221400 RepID=UPI001AAD0797|nr:N-acetylmuramic acid 6-phosphate etherase [Spirabiliibacterium pneumoniae]MBE2896304.1 N-acetylmuramic acid 6-phosphate etherase [Spirabiliibacterium pneumoniae]
MSENIQQLTTEGRLAASREIDTLSSLEVVKIINDQDKGVAHAVEKTLPAVASAVDAIVDAFAQGGRLIYLGAGTSGRLGILDASECPPTFGTDPKQVQGLIAGGQSAVFKAVENAEDDAQAGEADLVAVDLTAHDVVVGIAASGRTPYVLGGIQYAKELGCVTVGIACNRTSPLLSMAEIAIAPIVGAEVVSGSSRMKAGTAQKLVLNMLSTGAMILSGKVFGNLMVDVQPSNKKLLERQVNIVMQATDCDEAEAKAALKASNRHCKTAILMILTALDASAAKQLLQAHKGFIRKALAAHFKQ